MPAIINLTYAPNALPTLLQRADIQYACNQWTQQLANVVLNMTINVQVWAVDMTGTGLNGMCIPGIIQTAHWTLTRPQAKLLGDIVNPHDAAIDLVVVMDTATPWVLGTPPAVPIGPAQYSLSTTIMHEICHGLGFVGFCDVDTAVVPSVGIYTDANLIATLNHVVGLMNPVVVIPPHFFPAHPVSGFAVITPFANLFAYTNHVFIKGNPANDYTAFVTANDIDIPSPNAPGGIYTVLTGAPFQPFTSCDHITGGPYLMNSSTVGQYYAAPDAASIDILGLIGW